MKNQVFSYGLILLLSSAHAGSVQTARFVSSPIARLAPDLRVEPFDSRACGFSDNFKSISALAGKGPAALKESAYWISANPNSVPAIDHFLAEMTRPDRKLVHSSRLNVHYLQDTHQRLMTLIGVLKEIDATKHPKHAAQMQRAIEHAQAYAEVLRPLTQKDQTDALALLGELESLAKGNGPVTWAAFTHFDGAVSQERLRTSLYYQSLADGLNRQTGQSTRRLRSTLHVAEMSGSPTLIQSVMEQTLNTSSQVIFGDFLAFDVIDTIVRLLTRTDSLPQGILVRLNDWKSQLESESRVTNLPVRSQIIPAFIAAIDHAYHQLATLQK